jgi:SAM-dependent methyltransferase
MNGAEESDTMDDPPHDAAPRAPLTKERAGSFGAVAADYERFRPGPPTSAVEWFLPASVERVVDLGAGTGALTRLLIDRAVDVVAVEPDDRMRAVLSERVPGATAVPGRAESLPLPDASADAVLASSSWHWVDPVAAVTEAARVLVPGGLLGAVWSGPDPEGPFMAQARDLLARRAAESSDTGPSAGNLGQLIFSESLRPEFVLTIPAGMPFSEPEHQVFSWDVALNADDLVGLLGTLSWIITMPDDERDRVITTARHFLRELLGIDGQVTVDVTFRADAWRCRRDDA